MSESSSAGEVTGLLHAWCAGDRAALRRLIPLIYGELRRLARRVRRNEGDVGPATTTLVHEAYLRLCGADLSLRNRAHFMALAARAMRRILVDQARERAAIKRKAPPAPADLGNNTSFDDEVLSIHESLQKLSLVDPRLCRLVELRFFGGLTEEEAAAALGISVPTLKRDWALARAFLVRRLRAQEA